MLQQHVDNVCVSLLRCLMQRCVSILIKEHRHGVEDSVLWFKLNKQTKKNCFYLGFGIDTGALL